MKNNSEWWRTAAQHMWRTYYAIRRKQASPGDTPSPPVSDADMRIYNMCHNIVSNMFDQHDQDILQMYFTSPWGCDIHAVEDYSLRHNVPVNVIWIVVRRANRAVIEHLGILDKKIVIGSHDDNV